MARWKKGALGLTFFAAIAGGIGGVAWGTHQVSERKQDITQKDKTIEVQRRLLSAYDELVQKTCLQDKNPSSEICMKGAALDKMAALAKQGKLEINGPSKD